MKFTTDQLLEIASDVWNGEPLERQQIRSITAIAKREPYNTTLGRIARAITHRSRAVTARLSGDIDLALEYENLANNYIGRLL